MTIKDLEELYNYCYWANDRLLQVVVRLTPEEFVQPVAGSYQSVRNTLVHTLSAEWGWLERCGGLVRGPRLSPEDYTTADSLVQAWRTVQRAVLELLSKLNDPDLKRQIEFNLPDIGKHSMELGEMMQHAATHGIHHRAQVALLLRMLGHEPAKLDLLFYLDQKSAH